MHYRLCLFFHENFHIKAHLGPFLKLHTKSTFKGPLEAPKCLKPNNYEYKKYFNILRLF